MKQILVTGCAGFIGAATCDQLIQEDWNVVGIDNLNNYYDIQLKNWRLAQLENQESFSFVRGDIEDTDFLNDLFRKNNFTAVINLAAMAGVRYSIDNPSAYINTNVLGTVNLLECMKTYIVEKLVLASTSSLYAGQDMPFLESLPVNNPISPYAASTKAAEVMAYTYHHLHGIDVTVNRFFTVYGPAGRPDMSPFRFIRWIDEGRPIKLYGDGSQSRDFTYVEDVARGVALSLKNVGYQIINIGGGEIPISINQMIETFEVLLGKKAKTDLQPFNTSDMMHTSAEINKAHRILNWEPKTDFSTGMRQTVQWYLENREWVSKIAE